MKKILLVVMMLAPLLLLTACNTPSKRVANMRLGMTPDEVLEEMGRPYAIRAAKLYRDGGFQEVWEYIPSVFSVALFADRYDKSYWVFFDGGKVVQWGEPGDLTGSATVTQDDAAVTEYIPERRAR